MKLFASQLFILSTLIVFGVNQSAAQFVIPEVEPGEKPGQRPYEIVWANRSETAPPDLRFDSLAGWRMDVQGGAEGVIQPSIEQNIWDRPVMKLRYRGNGTSVSSPRLLLTPPKPVDIPDASDVVDMWIYGNRWDWMPTPDTPPVRVILHLRDNTGKPFDVLVDNIRWEYWFLCHKKLPSGLQYPVKMESLEIAGGYQTAWKELYFDSISFYKENLKPLSFQPRPKRNLTLFDGQSSGANIGPGTLPFPTREETILPMTFTNDFKTGIVQSGKEFLFKYTGKDCIITYSFNPDKGLAGIRASVDGGFLGNLMEGAEVRKASETKGRWELKRTILNNGILTAQYNNGTELRLQVMQKSLVVDVINRTASISELSYGRLTDLKDQRTIWVPFITYGGSHPAILLSKAGQKWAYTSIFPDWYRSNGSEIYGLDNVSGSSASINGGVRYIARTDGSLNPMFERLFLTVSPVFEEVLPTVPNPVGLHASDAVDKLWQETWGPADYATEMKRGQMIRAYGIDKFIQCNHELVWRDGGESFTVRTRTAPQRGGDAVVKDYINHQRNLGWISGLYTNYTDFSPVNEYWNPDYVQLGTTGEWRGGWPRCWALKPLRAVELDALIAPQVQKNYGTNSSYTDVHTAVPPWIYNDYDARVPAAGTLAQTFYAYGELLRNDSKVYGGPIFSEGTYHWMYAGLADGNYGHTYDGRQLAKEPLLPAFDLYQIHTKECDIGISWTDNFCQAIPDWTNPKNIDNAIDRFLLHILAYGHIGWLVEEQHGIERMCRSYYMLQQVQARYGLKPPVRIAYWDGKKLVNTSQAIVSGLPSTRRQLHIEYPGGLKLWLNDHPTDDWIVKVDGKQVVLPPAGWAAVQSNQLLSYSAIINGSRSDYMKSAAYIYQDGRGKWFSTSEAGSNGGLAIRKIAKNELEVIRISGDDEFSIKRPFSMKGIVAACEAYGVDGRRLSDPVTHDNGAETSIEPVKDAIRYVLRFSGIDTWSITPSVSEVVAGGRYRISVNTNRPVQWKADGAQIQDGILMIPGDAPAGTIIRVYADMNGEHRSATVRISAPVHFRWKSEERKGGAVLKLIPAWQLLGIDTINKLRFDFTAGEGWLAEPRSVELDPRHLPESIPINLSKSSSNTSEGKLSVVLTGLTQPYKREWMLKSVARDGIVADLTKTPFYWGICPRGGVEGPDTGTMAQCFVALDTSVGGKTRPSIFMHPPYSGMIGYTWAEFANIRIPDEPSRFSAYIGLKDGGDPSDGAVFKVELIDEKRNKHLLVEKLGVQGEWREISANLSRFAGQRVTLKLTGDPGPNDNTAADWISWGEPKMSVTSPGTTTRISDP